MFTILSILIFLGAVVVFIGSYFVIFEVMIAGRFIYALGGDSITVVQWTLVLEYFSSEKEIGKALNIIYVITSLAYSANLICSPLIAKVIL